MTIRISVTVEGRRIGSLLLDPSVPSGQAGRVQLVVAPTSTERELFAALGEAYGELQGREWKVGVEG